MKLRLNSLLFFIAFNGFTQQSDSLSNWVTNLTKTNTDSAITFFMTLVENEPNKAISVGKDVLSQLKTDERDSLVMIMKYEMGQLHLSLGQLKEASKYFDALINTQGLFQLESQSYGYKGLGDLAEQESNYMQAINYFLKAEHGWQTTRNFKRLGYLYNNIGVSYRKQGNNYRALQHYIKAVEMLEKVDDLRATAYISNNIGNIYLEQQELDQALEYYELALKHGLEIEDNRMVAYVSNNIGLIYSEKKELNKAHQFFQQGLKTSHHSTDKEAEILSLTNLGESCIDLAKYDSAEFFLHQALQKSRESNDRESQAFSLIGLGKLWYTTGNYAQAKINLADGLTIAKEIRQTANEREAYFFLALIYEAEQNFEAALKYQKSHRHVSDSLKQIEQTQNISLLKAEYEFKVESEKQEGRIQSLTIQNEIQELKLSQRNLMLWIIGVISILILVIGYLSYNQRLVKRKNEANDLKQKLLRLQLNPHFMFNALNAIQNLVYREAEKQKTADYLAKFSHLTRQILELNQHDFITLEDEMSFVENYLSIQQIRFDDPFHFEIGVDENIHPDAISIPPMITQPFLENAIEHGIINKNEQGKIKLKVTTDNSYIHILIEDNGVGRDAAAFERRTKKHRSLATQITRDRLENLQKSFRKQASMIIEDVSENGLILGTRVMFKLPIKLTE